MIMEKIFRIYWFIGIRRLELSKTKLKIQKNDSSNIMENLWGNSIESIESIDKNMIGLDNLL